MFIMIFLSDAKMYKATRNNKGVLMATFLSHPLFGAGAAYVLTVRSFFSGFRKFQCVEF